MIEYLIGILVILLFAFYKKTLKHEKFPPGPPKLPFVGSSPFFPEKVKKGEVKFQTYLQEEYGPIAGMYMGDSPVVVVSDYQMIKELYKKYETSGRPSRKPFHEMRFGTKDGKQRGLLQSTGTEWQEQRRFSLKQLRDIGFGKSSMEDQIMEEVDKLCNLLEKDVDKETSLNLKFNLSIVNALWLLLSGERFELEDPKLKALVSKFDQLLRMDPRMSFIDQILQSISPELTKKFNKPYKEFSGFFNDVKNMVSPAVHGHKKVLDTDNPQDFIDVFLTEVEKTTDPNSSFYGKRGEESLIASLLDLFLAGAETTSSSLLWAILFLLHHPEVQSKVQTEIDEIVGSNRRVTLDDRASMPYTNAVLMESMRMATIVPNALAHSALEDIEFNGYVIPKGTIIFANILHVHYDPEYWPNPEEFNPNRFMDPQSQTFKTNERLIPFSIGKRYCLGQSLAEKEYFLFFVGLLQKFQFQAVQPLPKIGRDSGTVVGSLRTIPLYKTIIKKRNV